MIDPSTDGNDLEGSNISTSEKLKALVNEQDLEAIVAAQQATLQRLEKSNEMLLNCNRLSARQLVTANEKFQRHTAVLQEMRKDLQSIFSRIRHLRTRISSQYPGQFSLALEKDMQNVSAQQRTPETDTAETDEKSEEELYDGSTKSYFGKDAET